MDKVGEMNGEEGSQNSEITASDAKLEVNGYTAGDICGMAPLLDGIGVYNFLVDLRDNPEAAQKAIDSGFVVK